MKTQHLHTLQYLQEIFNIFFTEYTCDSIDTKERQDIELIGF